MKIIKYIFWWLVLIGLVITFPLILTTLYIIEYIEMNKLRNK